MNQGPTLTILKTSEGAICGGYTSKSWDGNSKWTHDIDAFVFNMTQKYVPSNYEKAVATDSKGFMFGNYILGVTSSTKLNRENQGRCLTGKQYHYEIEGDVSPLTNQKERFTCAQLEVYKIVYC